MRIAFVIFFNTLGCLIGGGLIAASIYQSSATFQLAAAAGGMLVAATAGGWAWWTVTRGKRALENLQPGQPLSSGIVEFDEVLQRLGHHWQGSGQLQSQDAQELDEIKRLLETIDRRQGGYDRDGNALSASRRLLGILSGYGRQIDSNVRRAHACGRELRRAVDELVSGSENQSDLMNQTTHTVEELSARIFSVCDTATQALEASQQAKRNAEDGLSQFRELAEDMKRIRNHVAARERKLQALGQHTREIESIVATIGSLSSRTDLLALNASIESVRAGEHGRGFAVVAEEVRALAEQSAQAVVDITSRIEMIQLETHQSISGASGEHDQMHQVIQRVTDSLSALEQLVEMSKRSSDGLAGIAQDANRQLELAQQVVGTMEQSADCSQKNRSRAEGANWTAKTLDDVNQQLGQSLDLFRLSGVIESTPGSMDSDSVPLPPVSTPSPGVAPMTVS